MRCFCKSIINSRNNIRRSTNNQIFFKVSEKILQDNLIDKKEYESLCSVLNKYVEENTIEFFLKREHKIKINCFL